MKLFLAALLLLTVPAPALAGDIVGRASIRDGDTIEIHGQAIRLFGVDAPESWQICTDGRGIEYRCGRIAAEALDDFLAGSRPTRCQAMSVDRYGRIVGSCERADRLDVSAWMVRNGFAIDYRKYSRGRYLPEQSEAKRHKRGIWSGTFTPPWEARRMKRGS